MDKESDTHRYSGEHRKPRPGHKKRKLVFILFHTALRWSWEILKLYVAELRAGVTRLEMRSKTEGIFLFVTVTVALMELSDYSAMKRHGFITRKTELPTTLARCFRCKLFREENFFVEPTFGCHFSCRFTLPRNLSSHPICLLLQTAWILKACRANALTFPRDWISISINFLIRLFALATAKIIYFGDA